jgi:hypothetical protein
MRVTLLLADAAEAVNGKLYVLGGGWSVTGPGPVPFAIALKIEVPWDQANVRHELRLELLDSDGRPVLLQQEPEGDATPLVIGGSFEVGRPPGLPAGTPLDSVLAVTFSNGLPLEPGSRFEWRLSIDDETRDDWRLAFYTRPAPPATQASGH